MARILIIGYGNTLRGDDAVGIRAAEELQRYYRDDPDVAIIAGRQLTPELAEQVSGSELVIFLDASASAEPGKIWQTRVLPTAGAAGFTHQLTPASLLAAAGRLYGHVPEALCITMAGWSYGLDDKLSRRAEMLLPVLIGQAKGVVESHQRQEVMASPTSK